MLLDKMVSAFYYSACFLAAASLGNTIYAAITGQFTMYADLIRQFLRW